MFVGGQMFENSATNVASTNAGADNDNAITYHGKPIEIKDRLNRFGTLSDNIWNNPYRATSSKIRGFYHASDQEFKCKFYRINTVTPPCDPPHLEIHLTDNEIARIQKMKE